MPLMMSSGVSQIYPVRRFDTNITTEWYSCKSQTEVIFKPVEINTVVF